MAKAQHAPDYQAVPSALRQMREAAGLTQREVGRRMRKPQSWVYNCESANRRVDVTELIGWCRACDVEPSKAFRRIVDALG
jgi:transcriptional regulator with XRE-family HTH domain